MKQIYIVVCALFFGACSNRQVFYSEDGRARLEINPDVLVEELEQCFRNTPKTQEECWRMVSRGDMRVTCLIEDDSDKLQELIDQGLPINNYFDAMGNSECINTTVSEGFASRTLLLDALLLGAVKCARLLLDCNVDAGTVDTDGYNALMLSACLPEDVTVEMMDRICRLSTLNVNARSRSHETALSIAVDKNNKKCIDWLLQHGVDYNATTCSWINPECAMPIWFTAVNARQDIFETFLNLPGIDIQAKDSYGGGVLTWLHTSLDDYDERFRRLFESGARLSTKDAEEIAVDSMRELGDCKTRMAMICSYLNKGEILEKALRWAKWRQYLGCVEVLQGSGKQEVQSEGK